MAILDIRDCSFRYGRFEALSHISLSLEEGRFYALLGPNGSGKSTLLSLITGAHVPQQGTISVAGKALDRMSTREKARTIAFVPQNFFMDFPFSVREIIMMGRYAHQGLLGAAGRHDEEIVEKVMDITHTASIAERPVTGLSGGELQRVILAQALAQQSRILLLDEPTSHLDIRFQLEIMELLAHLNRTEGITILAALHDMNLASHYCHELFLMKKGGLITSGPVSEVFTEGTIAHVFEAPVTIMTSPEGRKVMVLRSMSMPAEASADGGQAPL